MNKIEEMSQKKSRTVERTEGWIFQALMSLLDEKSYSRISISDITKKAGVARTSFYRHYQSKDDILLHHIRVVSGSLLRQMVENAGCSPVEILTLFFRSVAEHQDIIKKLFQDDFRFLWNSFADAHEKFLLAISKNALSPEENLRFQYALQYQFGGYNRLLLYWLKNDMALPPEEIAAVLDTFLSPFRQQNQCIIDLLIQACEKHLPASDIQI
jgi:AcrR family transcriptional regulator